MTISNFQMPDVFVIPPEEDHSPAWCYFDAAERGPNFSQVELLNSTFVLLDSTTADDRVECDIDYRSEINTFGQERRSDHEQDKQPLQAPFHPSRSGYRDIADDSDVIEVVKVGRNALGDEPVRERHGYPIQVTRSKTLKLRASRMFNSLKKVGKRKRGLPKPPVPEMVVLSPPLPSPTSGILPKLGDTADEEYVPGPSQGQTLSRRSSIIFPHFFADPGISRVSHPDVRLSEPDDSGPGQTQDVGTIHAPPRAASPSPSFVTKRRFSKIDLQKIFSIAATTSSPVNNNIFPTGLVVSNSDDIVLAPSRSFASNSGQGSYFRGVRFTDRKSHGEAHARGSVPGLATPAHALQVTDDKPPMELLLRGVGEANTSSADHSSLAAELYLNLGSDLDLNLPASTHEPTVYPAVPHNVRTRPSSTPLNMGDETIETLTNDVSFEMRLDSLHFDDLSFDVNKF